MLLQALQPAKVLEATAREVLSQTNCQINVGRFGLASGRGTEERYAHDANSTELLLMSLQGPYDLIAVHGSILLIHFRAVKIATSSMFL